MFKKQDGQINVSNQTCIHMSVRPFVRSSLVFVVFQWMVSYVVSLVLPSLIMTKNNPNPVEKKRKQNGSNETKPNQPTTSNWRLFQSVANLSAFFGYPHKSVHPSIQSNRKLRHTSSLPSPPASSTGYTQLIQKNLAKMITKHENWKLNKIVKITGISDIIKSKLHVDVNIWNKQRNTAPIPLKPFRCSGSI